MISQFIVHYLWDFIIVISVISCFAVALKVWFRFPDRTVDDVVDFLVPIDFERVESLLDPAFEWDLRRNLSSEEFRKIQRKRIHLYIEFLQRMTHNATILIQLGNREAEGRNAETVQLAEELQRQSVKVRVYTMAATMKLRLWLFLRVDAWHILPAPSLCDLREVYGIQGLESYYALRNSASVLFMRVGPAKLDGLLERI